ncbi:hypothetical protein ACL6C3_10325 [Capilliphycus salinus ALCB114379]|uniref:hypothetical protein n=1 Tax=Capilliphycus salinus TaxID=2768948 RepID=UPI0039A63BFF
MIVLYLCLLIAVLGTFLVKFVDSDEIHHILLILSGGVILGWGFLLAPFSIKLLISLVLLALCQRLYQITLKP